MARRLKPVGLEFTESAPLRLVFAREVSAPAPAVFRALAEDVTGWPEWFSAVTLARPTDDGAGREVRLRGGTRMRETILAADPDEVYAYRVDETNAPGIRALVEEWRLTPSGVGGTRVQWTFAADGVAAFRVGLRLGRAGLGRAFRDAAAALDRRIAANSRDSRAS
ncbi:SRPBCC family protein [Streptomyces sp. NBC_00063]|uniref:SRPBCC family protein n=1 Tax=Streptomyces sp. NBC_00063 TaxID=2975638 RepID=UPI003D74EBFC